MVVSSVDSLDEKLYELAHVLFPASEVSGSRAVQITSCHHREGVTTVTLALADFLAKTFGSDHVVVVEANVRAPLLTDLLGLKPPKTLVDVLMNHAPLEDSICQVAQTHFSVLPAGGHGGKAVPLLERALFARLPAIVAQLREAFAFILIDSPPLIPYVDATLISACADGVTIMVAAGVTPSQVLDHGIDKLKGANATILGTVLNKREYYIPKWLYRFI